MRQFNHAFKRFASFELHCQSTVCAFLLIFFSPFAANAQYSGYSPNFGFDRSHSDLRSLIEVATSSTETSIDGQPMDPSRSEPVAGGLIGASMRATSNSTASCSTYAPAPNNAQSLSHGSYTYMVTGSSSGTIWGTDT